METKIISQESFNFSTKEASIMVKISEDFTGQTFMIIKINGSFDMSAVDKLGNLFQKYENYSIKLILFDFQKTRGISSGGLAFLLKIERKFSKETTQIKFMNLSIGLARLVDVEPLRRAVDHTPTSVVF